MRRVVVRYETKAETGQENERLIRTVFEELRAKSPQGIRYLALKLNGGTFVHFSITETNDGSSPLRQLGAFRSFQAGITGRCIEAPQVSDATIVGNYRMLSEP